MNDNRYYLLTGAADFLDTSICMQLLEQGYKVQALVLPNDQSVKHIPEQVEVALGNLADAPSPDPFFTIPEDGCMEDIVKAMEHEPGLPEIDSGEACKSIETVVVDTYRKIEDTVVSGYRKVEKGAVTGFQKISDKFVEKLFSREGESVEETKERLRRK